MNGPTYPPAASAAQGPKYTGRTVQDAVTYVNYDPALATAKHVPYEVQCELLGLIRTQFMNGGAIQVWNGTGNTLAAGPVSLSGVYGADSVTGNPIFTIIPSDASGTAANFLLLSSLAPNTEGSAFAGGTFASTLNTAQVSLGAPVYLAIGGGLTTTVQTNAAITQIVGYVQTQAAAGVIAGLIQTPVYPTGTATTDAASILTDETMVKVLKAVVMTLILTGNGPLLDAMFKKQLTGTTAIQFAKSAD